MTEIQIKNSRSSLASILTMSVYKYLSIMLQFHLIVIFRRPKNKFTVIFANKVRDRVFRDKIKFYILRQNLHQTCFDDFSNVKWCIKQTSSLKVCQVAHASLAYLDKHSTLDPVMVSVVSSIPTEKQLSTEIF